MYRLLVTGGRDLPDAEVVWMPLFMTIHKHEQMIVVHGAHESGADLYTHEWIELPGQQWNRRPLQEKMRRVERLVIEERHPANWGRLGKAAGPLRNQEMVDAGADMVFAFPTPASKGTLDCMARAWVRGIPVHIWHHHELGRGRRLTEAEGEQLARHRLHWPDNMSDPRGKAHT